MDPENGCDMLLPKRPFIYNGPHDVIPRKVDLLHTFEACILGSLDNSLCMIDST
jgi:hypothetical protein